MFKKEKKGEEEEKKPTHLHAQQFSLHPLEVKKRRKTWFKPGEAGGHFGNIIIWYIYFSSYISLTNAVSPGTGELKGSMKRKLVNMWISGTGDKSALIRLQKHNPS